MGFLGTHHGKYMPPLSQSRRQRKIIGHSFQILPRQVIKIIVVKFLKTIKIKVIKLLNDIEIVFVEFLILVVGFSVVQSIICWTCLWGMVVFLYSIAFDSTGAWLNLTGLELTVLDGVWLHRSWFNGVWFNSTCLGSTNFDINCSLRTPPSVFNL